MDNHLLQPFELSNFLTNNSFIIYKNDISFNLYSKNNLNEEFKLNSTINIFNNNNFVTSGNIFGTQNIFFNHNFKTPKLTLKLSLHIENINFDELIFNIEGQGKIFYFKDINYSDESFIGNIIFDNVIHNYIIKFIDKNNYFEIKFINGN